MTLISLLRKAEDPLVDVRQGNRFCSISKRADQLWGQLVSNFRDTDGSHRGIKSAGT